MAAEAMNRSPMRQRGGAGVVPLGLLIYGALALGILIVVASMSLPFILKGRLRHAALACVVAGWGAFAWHQIIEPKQKIAWFHASFTQCGTDIQKLPSWLNVDGFFDEGAALSRLSLLQLFSERYLQVVEVKIKQEKEGGAVGRVVRADSLINSSWTVPISGNPIARLELSTVGDPLCVDELAEQLNRPPFLPGTCMKLSRVLAPSTRFALVLRPSAKPDVRQYGSWVLMDQSTGEQRFGLRTVDTPESIGGGTLLTRSNEQRGHGCHAPHFHIVDRFFNADGAPHADRHPQVLRSELVNAKVDVSTIEPSSIPTPIVSARAESTSYSQEEIKDLFGSTIAGDPWRKIVEQAQMHGAAGHGDMLVVWPERKLVYFDPIAEKKNLSWRAFAVGNGFLVASSFSWYESSDNLLARYAADGTLSWMARIGPPPLQDRTCRQFSPRAFYRVDGDLVIADQCIPLKPSDRHPSASTPGEVWKIPLRDLPGPL